MSYVRIAFLAVAALLILYWVWWFGKRAAHDLRLGFGILRIPLTGISAATEPTARVEGEIVRSTGPVQAPISGRECLAYEYELAGVDVLRKHQNHSKRLLRDGSPTEFVLGDGTGRITVRCTADTELSVSRANRTKTRAGRRASVPQLLVDRLERGDLGWAVERSSRGSSVDEETVEWVAQYDERLGELGATDDTTGPEERDPGRRVGERVLESIDDYTSGFRSLTRWLTCVERRLTTDDTIRLYGPARRAPDGTDTEMITGSDGPVLLSDRPWQSLTVRYTARGLRYSLTAIALVGIYVGGVYLIYTT
ncbi:hypothetical protein ACOZ4N_12940 [Halorientalis pallida]|uniref:hypothetical protein n=1 Tax=Halorientalis pallida TaxID=2479928 RepID=UPI003C6F5E3A